ncbi:hypothetical protein [uncultured Thiodictyon sp.]|uniref:hypothetical protein n=1 Tax=uncultured Thiodictyon sp. TaxID=1846217 RepID=UPI0025DEBCB5|nr:hypothetical protein [uncultured Thiodictyon sp.]
MAAHETPTGAPITPENSGNGRGDGVVPIGDAAGVTDARLNLVAIDRLSHAFESSVKRWELVVYPSLFAFIILATYGFYLVYSLAKDVHVLAITVDKNMTVLAQNMLSVSSDMRQISTDVRGMSGSVAAMSVDMKTLQPMLASMANMDRSMQDMTLNTTVMRDDIASMNRTIGRPMRMMNSFMPW